MREKRIVLVNDVTGLSRCSVACQLPIISAMGIETAFVPTAILSINTYHKDFFFDDYTSKMNDYIETYKKMNIDFDGICSGFLGSAKQIEIVKEFFKDFKTEKNFILVDPVMGDHGKLYPTYTQEMQEKMEFLQSEPKAVQNKNSIYPIFTTVTIYLLILNITVHPVHPELFSVHLPDLRLPLHSA